MTTTEIERTHEKDLNYYRTDADGVIMQFGKDTCKLIFYQEETLLTDDGAGIETQKESAKWKFEVILPRSALKYLVEYGYYLTRLEHFAISIQREQNNNEKVAKAWWEFDQALQLVNYDTFYGNKKLKAMKNLADKFNELTAISGMRIESLESDTLFKIDERDEDKND